MGGGQQRGGGGKGLGGGGLGKSGTAGAPTGCRVRVLQPLELGPRKQHSTRCSRPDHFSSLPVSNPSYMSSTSPKSVPIFAPPPRPLTPSVQIVRLHQLLHEIRFSDPTGKHLSPAGAGNSRTCVVVGPKFDPHLLRVGSAGPP